MPRLSPACRLQPRASRHEPLRGGSLRAAPRPEGEKPLAAPAVRLRAREAGVDLRQVPGTGPAGRITHEDLDAFFSRGPWWRCDRPAFKRGVSVEDVKVIGLRRKIAEKMALSSRASRTSPMSKKSM